MLSAPSTDPAVGRRVAGAIRSTPPSVRIRPQQPADQVPGRVDPDAEACLGHPGGDQVVRTLLASAEPRPVGAGLAADLEQLGQPPSTWPARCCGVDAGCRLTPCCRSRSRSWSSLRSVAPSAAGSSASGRGHRPVIVRLSIRSLAHSPAMRPACAWPCAASGRASRPPRPGPPAGRPCCARPLSGRSASRPPAAARPRSGRPATAPTARPQLPGRVAALGGTRRLELVAGLDVLAAAMRFAGRRDHGTPAPVAALEQLQLSSRASNQRRIAASSWCGSTQLMPERYANHRRASRAAGPPRYQAWRGGASSRSTCSVARPSTGTSRCRSKQMYRRRHCGRTCG